MFWSERVLPSLVDWVCSGKGPKIRRGELAPLAEGAVLDLGVGSGLNLAVADPAKVTRWVGIDPSRGLLDRATERAKEVGFAVELLQGVAEALPFDAATFDTALVTYTYCSVADPAAALRELERVVRPGGTLLFVEHGLAARESSRTVQRWVEPGWSRVAGGCHLRRDIVSDLANTAFEIERTEVHVAVPAWLSTVVSGVARRR
ncbi:MAG: class I SAM-dependent methyltransferase [Polyangiaceae bacterium]